jgi:hypothetical protein
MGGFLFGGLSPRFALGAAGSPPNKKMNPLRPLRLCGEKFVFGQE